MVFGFEMSCGFAKDERKRTVEFRSCFPTNPSCRPYCVETQPHFYLIPHFWMIHMATHRLMDCYYCGLGSSDSCESSTQQGSIMTPMRHSNQFLTLNSLMGVKVNHFCFRYYLYSMVYQKHGMSFSNFLFTNWHQFPDLVSWTTVWTLNLRSEVRHFAL